MDNLAIYELGRSVPDNAQKIIEAGRLKGMTDINPMWRIKKLTEIYGPCGIGWYYGIKRQWLEAGAENTVAAFTNIDLFVKHEGEWSKGIPGTGGSLFVSKEKGGFHTSDECYKMALTDAISVAAKALGIGGDVYYKADKTKYSSTRRKEASTNGTAKPQDKPAKPSPSAKPTNYELVAKRINGTTITKDVVAQMVSRDYGAGVKVNDLTEEQLKKLLAKLDGIAGGSNELRYL